ncbi:MAG: endonuclease/exonuclease/phosphatase family protein [Proteobacteria bacterium]|nr:endonuclease/exonuclease/phosphatase family protein [Pseudomonadota bacterium]
MIQNSMPITVMTLNLRFGLADDGKNSWEHRKVAYPKLFMQIRPDFIGVQEANNFQTDYLATVLDDYQYIGRREPSPDFWQNNIIFYKKPWVCRKSQHYFLSDTPHIQSQFPDSRWPRQCTIGLFEKKDRSLIHVNTHFDFKASVQMKSAALILDFLKDFHEKTDTIITGDFNTTPESDTYKLFIKSGFNDLFKNKHSSTFHGFTGKNLGGHIDWILFKGNLKGMDQSIIRESFVGIYPSDHYPVLSVFEFPSSP